MTKVFIKSLLDFPFIPEDGSFMDETNRIVFPYPTEQEKQIVFSKYIFPQAIYLNVKGNINNFETKSGIAQCSVVQCRGEQFSAVQYSAVQCSAVQCSTVQ